MSDSNNVPIQHPSPLVAVSNDLANLVIQPTPSPVSPTIPQNHPDSRPFIMYSRSQLLFLHKSPLVQLPNGMPALKDWFGTESDQSSSKKDSETTLSAGNTRDRRFRRDADDAGSARQSFRGAAITQPSQMGNFKHQSIRAADRDRDRDVEKEQDRERVKEGERLRNLSDKYDRDRRALSSISQMRTKDREIAPHLANPPRVTAQTASSRVSDSRDVQKKKDGESNEDWRRGADQARAARDRTENGRKDRDDRERPRSRVRDSSRSRRDGSPSRRDKEDRRMDRDDGYSYRKDRDDRDREFDRDSEPEDPRRWRDDGKREERIVARREREIRERELRDRRDRPAWEGGDRADRRWVTGDDRDSRGKGRAAEIGSPGEDGKDRDDRKDRDRDREKEPAWMDTYIPNSGSGVLGGLRSGGELDGIQAFRKEMQQKDKSTSPVAAGLAVSQTQASSPGQTPENQLDEIQLFRLMMKREEEKKKSDSPEVPPATHPSTESSSAVRVNTEAVPNLSLAPTPLNESVSHRSSPGEQYESAVVVVDVTPDVTIPISSASSPQTATSLVFNGQDSEPRAKLNPSELASALDHILRPVYSGEGTHEPRFSRSSSWRFSIACVGVPKPAKCDCFVGAVLLLLKALCRVSVNQPVEPSSHFPPGPDSSRPNNGFSPFDEHRDAVIANAAVSEGIHRAPLAACGHAAPSFEPVSSGIAAAKGSRFAKFFDGKSRDHQPAPLAKAIGLQLPQHSDARAMEDIFTMLNNSAQQAQRLGIAPELPNLDIGYGSPSNNLHALQSVPGHPHLLGPGRMDSLYDDRNFVPDGMVPGLRSVPPPRGRQSGAVFSDFPDESIQFNVNGQRGPTQIYQGSVPTAQFRGAPSPNHLASVQRLPPGLANLGGRPPHEPGQFVNASAGMANGGIHGTVHGSAPQPTFNNFQQPSLNFSSGPQIRGPHPGAHQLQGTLGPNALQGLVHPGNLGSNQAQLLGLSGANGVHGPLRGPGGAFGQQGPQVQPHIALRQHQQAQQQMPPHMLPLHLQQQGFAGAATNQPAHDLMALLMNGTRRD
ncbi:hypothetical protein JVU11DRAFT_5309 [Chiua virens]|nr:hypothetical protein JVU11DRAFT_5309 [Chiua virens]